MDIEQQRAALTHKTFVMMFHILLIFGIPAVLAYIVGKWLDTTYDMRPYGTLAALFVAIVTSWTLTIRMYLRIDRAFKALKKKEESDKHE